MTELGPFAQCLVGRLRHQLVALRREVHPIVRNEQRLRIGGLAELVVDGVSGRLVPPGDWRALAACLQAIAREPHATVDRWRRALPPARTMDDVAADYLELYRA